MYNKQRPNKSQKKRQNRKAGSVLTRKVATHPPPYVAQVIRTIRIRSNATAAVSAAFNYNDLSGLLGIIATAATTSVFWTTVFRLRKVIVWGPVTTAGVPVSVSLSWDNTAQDFESPPVKFSDTSISFDWPAFVEQSPPRGSLSDKWHGSAQTDLCFNLQCPQGSSVEFVFDFVLNDDSSPLAGPAIAGAVLGQLYHKIVNNLTPVGVNSI